MKRLLALIIFVMLSLSMASFAGFATKTAPNVNAQRKAVATQLTDLWKGEKVVVERQLKYKPGDKKLIERKVYIEGVLKELNEKEKEGADGN